MTQINLLIINIVCVRLRVPRLLRPVNTYFSLNFFLDELVSQLKGLLYGLHAFRHPFGCFLLFQEMVEELEHPELEVDAVRHDNRPVRFACIV